MARTKLTSKKWNWLAPPGKLKKRGFKLTRKKKVKKAVKKYNVRRLVRMIDDMQTGERFYEVEWEGYSEADNTVEPRKNLVLDIKGLVEQYERENMCELK
ncbi:MAG: hypothetical protein CMO44_02665 [Verrucomicrobiales bacterium]|nr:hypothetical protein [Verrucomicrobiales bacterium]